MTSHTTYKSYRDLRRNRGARAPASVTPPEPPLHLNSWFSGTANSIPVPNHSLATLAIPALGTSSPHFCGRIDPLQSATLDPVYSGPGNWSPMHAYVTHDTLSLPLWRRFFGNGWPEEDPWLRAQVSTQLKQTFKDFIACFWLVPRSKVVKTHCGLIMWTKPSNNWRNACFLWITNTPKMRIRLDRNETGDARTLSPYPIFPSFS